MRAGAKCEIWPDDEHSVRVEVGSYWLVATVEAVGTLHRWTVVRRFDEGSFSTQALVGGSDQVEYEGRGAEIGDEERLVVVEGGEHRLEIGGDELATQFDLALQNRSIQPEAARWSRRGDRRVRWVRFRLKSRKRRLDGKWLTFMIKEDWRQSQRQDAVAGVIERAYEDP